jgi:serine/threonine protein kinase
MDMVHVLHHRNIIYRDLRSPSILLHKRDFPIICNFTMTPFEGIGDSPAARAA